MDIGVGAHTPQTAMNLAENSQPCENRQKSRIRKSGDLREKTSFWKRQTLFSLPDVGSLQEAENDVHNYKDRRGQQSRLKMNAMILMDVSVCTRHYFKTTGGVHVSGERTFYLIMEEIGISHCPKRKPNGITKADRETRKFDGQLERNFKPDGP